MRGIAAVFAAAALVVGPVATASVAQANTTAGAVRTAGSDAPTAGGQQCGGGYLSNGTLTFCDQVSWPGSTPASYPTISYYKSGGDAAITAQFYWYNPDTGSSVWDQGAFTQNYGETKSFSWGQQPFVWNCSAVYGGMFVYGANQNFVTKSVNIC